MSKINGILGAGAIVLALAGAAMAEGPGADTVVATVNGTEITLGHMLALRGGLPPEYRTLPDDVLFDGILEQLIQQTALAKIGEDRMTQRDTISLEVQRRAYLSNSLLAYTAERAVTEEAVMEAYEAKYAGVEPREYHAAHILVETQEEAQAIKDEIEAGADFAEVAKAKSSDGAATNGGDLGWFQLTDMVEPFAEAVAAMEEGALAGPVETRYGFHVVKLMETRIAEAPTIEDVREELEGDIRQQAVEARVTETLENAAIERMVEGIDPAILKDETILGN